MRDGLCSYPALSAAPFLVRCAACNPLAPCPVSAMPPASLNRIRLQASSREFHRLVPVVEAGVLGRWRGLLPWWVLRRLGSCSRGKFGTRENQIVTVAGQGVARYVLQPALAALFLARGERGLFPGLPLVFHATRQKWSPGATRGARVSRGGNSEGTPPPAKIALPWIARAGAGPVMQEEQRSEKNPLARLSRLIGLGT